MRSLAPRSNRSSISKTMPTYDLECATCEHHFEVFRHGFLRDEDRSCPECSAPDATQRWTGGFLAVTSSRSDPSPAASGGGCGATCGCGGH